MRTAARICLGFLVMVTGAMSVATSAVAQCWDCVPDGDMNVCVGTAPGLGTYYDCGPTWSFEGPCKHSETQTCGGSGCPGCFRYPALAERPKPRPMSTQVLIFSLVTAKPLPCAITIPAGGANGLDPESAAHELRSAGVRVGALIGFSAETNTGMIFARHRAPDGSGMSILARPSRNGFVVRLYGLTGNATAQALGSVWSARGEAAAFPIQLAGQPCLVVVHAGSPLEGTREAAFRTFHEPFMEAAQRYPGAKLLGIKVDDPQDAMRALVALGIADEMHAKALRGGYR